SAVTVDLAHFTASNGFSGGTDTFSNIEWFKGGSGNDIFYGGPGSHTIDGGGGTNTLDYSAASPAAVVVNIATGTATNGFGGTDHFSNIQSFKGGSGSDVFDGGHGAQTLTGGAGADKFVFDAAALADTTLPLPISIRITDYDAGNSVTYNAAE